MVNGYKRFDPSRGLDYILDLNFKDTIRNRFVQKRYGIMCLTAFLKFIIQKCILYYIY